MTQEAGPSSVLDAIKAFKDAQEQRVNHWKEYDEAVSLRQSQQREQASSSALSSDPVRPLNGGAAAAAAPPPASEHYRSETLPITDDVFAKIVSLVTSGLLDSSHSVRTVETELRSRFQQHRLADFVGQVQDLENAVLRSIVQRDQERRKADVEGRDWSEEKTKEQDETVQSLRRQIQDVMDEINAEVAEVES